MIKVNQNELFPLSATVLDECNGQAQSGLTVYYDVRDDSDSVLSPAVSGVMPESAVEQGVYKTTLSLPDSGIYFAYVSSSGINSGTEEIIVNEENIYDLAKNDRHYNISVEDVLRTNPGPTASQTARNVPLNKTDYVREWIRDDGDADWSSPVASGIVYAHYTAITDEVPYKMGGPF